MSTTPTLRELDQKIIAFKKTKPTRTTDKEKLQELKSQFAQLYNQLKRQVLKLEETNTEYLILMPSTNGFYKMFEHSALFYVMHIAPQLNLHANLQIDKDYDQKSSVGFVAFRDLSTIGARLEQLRIVRERPEEVSEELVVYHLPWEFKDEQIERFTTLNDSRVREFNQLTLPTNAIPVLFYAIMNLNQAVYQNVRRMPPVERELYGQQIGTAAAKLMYEYLHYANGELGEEEYIDASMELLKDFRYRVKLVTDLKIWEARLTARVAQEMIKTLDVLKNEARRIAKEKLKAEQEEAEEEATPPVEGTVNGRLF